MLRRLSALFDPFLLMLIGTVTLASLLPARGWGASIAGWLADGAILLLFFLHGAKLSRAAIVAGASKWKLHLAVLATSFLFYPLLGLGAEAVAWQVAPAMAAGLLYLSLLPSTVQSSIAFTSIAGGDVPAAIGSASLSSIVGIFATPLLAQWLMGAGGSSGAQALDAILKIGGQLLLPFAAGHMLRPWIGGFIDRHKPLVGRVDRGSILFLVYTVFSAAVVEGLWHQTDVGDLLAALAIGVVMLAIVLVATLWASRALGWAREDEIVWRFCGSKKSLVAGVPLAAAIFPPAQVGMLLLPLMIFHQAQLMICSVMAKRYATQKGPAGVAA
ncbi:bile acid:sodium symporter family protein [Sphingomonas abietis]|uniref:Bile acid:sodium symporter n=1 Tax=Sphingomonas abietis TaxID=3012344 RepID=A0ABY7NNQ2_9SPHN|nr:bile acid:sodium symporter family protein [Sphingomonas abietis]WBO22207.1 bile acid:sodium symporter [Sphingomonas abietis]